MKKNKKIFVLPIIALSGLFLASCKNTSDSLNGSSSYVNITFDGNGGTVDKLDSKQFTFRKGLSWQYVKKSIESANIYKSGYTSVTSSPWAFDKKGDNIPGLDTKFTTDTTLYAHYVPNNIFVKFDPNGGKWSDSSTDIKEVKVKYDSTYGAIKTSYIPTPPFGKEFTHFTTGSGETLKTIGDDYIFQKTGEVLTANYIDSADYVSVTFDCNGGHVKDETSTTKSFSVIKNSTWGDLESKIPTVVRDGYEQDKTHLWTKTKDGTDSPQATDIISNDLCVFAKWNANDINVKLNPNGGKIDGSTSTKSVTVKYNSKFGAIKSAYIPTREGYTFTHFTNSKSEVVGDDYVFTSDNEELKANYIEIAEYVSITFDCNGGHVKDATATTKTVTVVKGSAWSTIKSNLPVVERTGYSQNEKPWTKTKDGTDEPIDTDTFNTNTTIYAKWDRSDITIKLNPNGGTWTDTTSTTKEVSVKYDSKYSDITTEKIPTPPTGKKFVYYTVGTDNKIVGDDYVFNTAGEELKAFYVDEGGGSETITVKFDATSAGSIYGLQERTYVLATGTKFSQLKDNVVATPNDKGYKFKSYTYDSTKTLEDTTEFVKDMDNKTFTATYEIIEASNFSTDSWATVINNATSLDNLKKVYKLESTETFVGKTRTVTIDDVDYTVKVIGEDHDILTDDTSKKAVLTFQFENLVDDGISYAYSYSSSSNYGESKLKSYLNTNLYKRLPSDLQSGIKAVNKGAYDASTSTVKTYSDKLFALSMTEMGYTTLPDGSTTIQTEGTKYNAYKDTTLETEFKKTLVGTTTNSSYMLRSPAFSGETGAVWGINTEGLLGFDMSGHTYRQPESVNTGMGVLPAFAI